LPLVQLWQPSEVYYFADVVTHKGSTWQALKDTGQEPGGDAWVCLARGGADGAPGRSLNICKTYDPQQAYAHLDVVTRDSGWFVAIKDNPGTCPGPDWKAGPTGKIGPRGERGPPGEKGDPADVVMSWRVDRQLYLAVPVMSSGAEGPVLDLRSLFEQFEAEALR
jgi:hypothetical protein